MKSHVSHWKHLQDTLDTLELRDAIREKNGGPPLGNFSHIIPFFSLIASLPDKMRGKVENSQ